MIDTMSKEPFLFKINFTSVKPPQFVEKSDKAYIYFGEKNDYPQYLTELYKRSVMHSTIVDSKIKFICGGGWSFNKTGFNTTEASKVNEWLKEPGVDNLRELTFKVTQDIELYNAVALEIIWTNSGKISEINHIPYSYIRSNKDGSEFYYTSKWCKTDYKGNRMPNQNPADEEDFTVYKPYDPDNKKGKQLFYYKVYFPELETYTLPNYLSAITSIDTEIRIDNWHNNFIRKGFSASHMINFYNGVPQKEEQKKIKEKIKQELTSDDEAGSFVLNFAVDREHGSEIINLTPTGFDKQFEQLRQDVKDNILQRHGITNPAMVGMLVPGKLGGSTASEVKIGVEQFQNLYVRQRQDIVEDIFNELLQFEGKKVLKLKQLEPVGIEITEGMIEKYLPKAAVEAMVAERMGIDLTLYRNVPMTPRVTESKEFSIEKDLVSRFAKRGISKDEVEIGFKREFEFTSEEEQFNSEQELIKMTFAEKKKEQETVSGQIGYTPKQAKTAAKDLEIDVMYSYEFKSQFSDDGRSRPFCSDMMALNRLYTKEDMEAINQEIKANDEYKAAFGDLEINVWKHRGGWYRKPNTDISVSNCRHVWWQQVIIKRKK